MSIASILSNTFLSLVSRTFRGHLLTDIKVPSNKISRPTKKWEPLRETRTALCTTREESPRLVYVHGDEFAYLQFFTWRFYYILYILPSDEIIYCGDWVIMRGSYLSVCGGGRSGRRIPFWCNLGRAAIHWETQWSHVTMYSIHVIVTMERVWNFWTIRSSRSFQWPKGSLSSLPQWYLKLTSEIKEEETVWSCRCISDSCDTFILYCSFLRLFNPYRETILKSYNIQHSG